MELLSGKDYRILGRSFPSKQMTLLLLPVLLITIFVEYLPLVRF
jgi:hypothetical protein